MAGDFTKINNKGPNHIQLLNVNTGQAVTSFEAPSTNGGIETIEMLPNNRLFIGGFFTKIAGVTHGQMGTLNAATGDLDPFVNVTVSGHRNTSGSGAQAPVGIRESAVTPAGDRMVVTGNFRVAGGLSRVQIVMLDLTGAKRCRVDDLVHGPLQRDLLARRLRQLHATLTSTWVVLRRRHHRRSAQRHAV